jgi:hypothetical protein
VLRVSRPTGSDSPSKNAGLRIRASENRLVPRTITREFFVETVPRRYPFGTGTDRKWLDLARLKLAPKRGVLDKTHYSQALHRCRLGAGWLTQSRPGIRGAPAVFAHRMAAACMGERGIDDPRATSGRGVLTSQPVGYGAGSARSDCNRGGTLSN